MKWAWVQHTLRLSFLLDVIRFHFTNIFSEKNPPVYAIWDISPSLKGMVIGLPTFMRITRNCSPIVAISIVQYLFLQCSTLFSNSLISRYSILNNHAEPFSIYTIIIKYLASPVARRGKANWIHCNLLPIYANWLGCAAGPLRRGFPYNNYSNSAEDS